MTYACTLIRRAAREKRTGRRNGDRPPESRPSDFVAFASTRPERERHELSVLNDSRMTKKSPLFMDPEYPMTDKNNMQSCQNCDAMQEFAEGTGPTRMKFNQPTMYDHMESYCKFKNAKLADNPMEDSKECSCSTPHPKFTNLKLGTENRNEVVGNSNQQDLPRGKRCQKNSESKFSSDTGKKNIHSTDSLITISRSPINCPVTACSQTIGITSVLSHFLRDHKQNFPVDFQDIGGNRRSVLVFDESIFEYNENICLGILAYGGKDETENGRPGLAGISRANSFLPEKYSHFHYHLPVLIMACKITLNAILADKELGAQHSEPEDNTKDIILLWLVTVEVTKSIHCTITVFDQEMTASRSTIVQIRNLKYSQNPVNFMPHEVNYLMLNRGELNILSNNGEASIEIEINIHEFDD